MSEWRSWIEEHLALGVGAQEKLLYTLLVILAVVVLRRLTLWLAERRLDDPRARYRWSKTSAYLGFVLGVILVGRVWFEGLRSLWTFLGLVGAGLAIALKDLVGDLAAWGFILWRRPFEVGDRIQIGDHTGDVIDIRIFQFTLLETGNWVDADQSTGRLLHIPNIKVLTDALANYTRGFPFIWNEIPVLVTFESDWRRAKEVLQEVATRHASVTTEEAQQRLRELSSRFLIFYTKLTPVVYTRVEDSGVLLTIRYLCEPRRRRGTEEEIWEDVLEAFAGEPEVDFAYPTWRIYDLDREGRPPAGREPRSSPEADLDREVGGPGDRR